MSERRCDKGSNPDARLKLALRQPHVVIVGGGASGMLPACHLLHGFRAQCQRYTAHIAIVLQDEQAAAQFEPTARKSGCGV